MSLPAGRDHLRWDHRHALGWWAHHAPGAHDLGWHGPYDLVHVLEAPFAGIAVVGGLLAWLVNTLCSAVLGLAWGLVVMAIVHPLLNVLPFGKKKGGHEEGAIRAAAPATGHRNVTPQETAVSDNRW